MSLFCIYFCLLKYISSTVKSTQSINPRPIDEDRLKEFMEAMTEKYEKLEQTRIRFQQKTHDDVRAIVNAFDDRFAELENRIIKLETAPNELKMEMQRAIKDINVVKSRLETLERINEKQDTDKACEAYGCFGISRNPTESLDPYAQYDEPPSKRGCFMPQ
jgi:DNA repair exonuclease SbcCD ATPase subunit